jgi:hypothetical protein
MNRPAVASKELSQKMRFNYLLRAIAYTSRLTTQYTNDDSIQDVRRVLGWGQSAEKDCALKTACRAPDNRYLQMETTWDWLIDWTDDTDVARILAIRDPSHIKRFSNRIGMMEEFMSYAVQITRNNGSEMRYNERDRWLNTLALPAKYLSPKRQRIYWYSMPEDLQRDPKMMLALHDYYSRWETCTWKDPRKEDYRNIKLAVYNENISVLEKEITRKKRKLALFEKYVGSSLWNDTRVSLWDMEEHLCMVVARKREMSLPLPNPDPILDR